MSELLGVKSKRCRDCEQILPATTEFFNRRTVHKDGLNTFCRSCSRLRGRANYAATREKILANRRTNRVKYREHERRYWARQRERKREKDRRWRLAHPDRARAHNRRKYLRDPDKVKTQLREWALAHPEYVAEHARRKNLRRRGAPLTEQARAYVSTLLGDPCA